MITSSMKHTLYLTRAVRPRKPTLLKENNVVTHGLVQTKQSHSPTRHIPATYPVTVLGKHSKIKPQWWLTALEG